MPDFADPQSLNRYSYVVNNPVKLVDPSGHFGFLAAVIVGAIVGGTSAAIQGGDLGDILEGMAIGAAAGAVGYGVGAYVGNTVSIAGVPGGIGPPTAGWSMAGSVVGGMAGGAAAGTTASGMYGGDISKGALYGAAGGAAFGAIGGHYGDSWSMGRVGLSGLAGGGVSELAGEKFGEGFAYAASFAFAAYSYNKLFGMSPDGRVANKNADIKREQSVRYLRNTEKTQNAVFGRAGCDGFLCEGASYMEWTAKNVPFVQQGSVMHDLVVDVTPKLLQPVLLFPTIPPTVAFTATGATAQYAPITAPIILGINSINNN